MAFGWNKASEQSAAAKMGPGVHAVRVSKIVTGGKSGPFKSKSGDPQIMVVYESEDNAEASEMLTLSEKAGWTLARLLSRVGVDLDAMERDGIEPRHFAQKEMAESHLLGKSLWIRVEHEVDEGGKLRVRATPLHESEARSLGGVKAEDEIPF